MEISVVIPTYNRCTLVARVLKRVFDQDFPTHLREVIVVVDGSKDGTAERIRTMEAPCRFKIIEQPNSGPAAARNAGVRAATGNIILFLDDDLLCDRHLLSRHIAAHARHPSSLVFGPNLVAPESPQNAATDLFAEWYSRYCRRLKEEGGPRSKYDVWVYSNCSIPHELFLASGGYDESFRWAAEDADLAVRLWEAGVAFQFEPAAIVYQFYDKSPEHLVSIESVRLALAELMLSDKHPGYRPHSRLAKINEGWARRFVTFLAWQIPVSPELLLRVLFHLAQALRAITPMRRVAVRLLQLRMGIESTRAAIRQVGSWRASLSQFGARLPILLYHDVGDPALGVFPEQTVSPEKFERQVKWLASRGYSGIRLADWLAWRDEGKPLPDKPVLLSFDDGYSGVAKYALPVLERYGFKAVVFVVTSRVGKTNAWDEAIGVASRPLMTAEDIRYWNEQGFEFGSHSRTHADLTILEASELESEVAGSRDDLTEILGSPPTAFAYPYGRFNQDVRRCVTANFASALSTIRGVNTMVTDLHLLRRSAVRPRDWIADLACRVRFGMSPIVTLPSWLRYPLAGTKRWPARRLSRFRKPSCRE